MENNDKDDDNNKDDNNDKGISALGLDRDLGFGKPNDGRPQSSRTYARTDFFRTKTTLFSIQFFILKL